VEITTVATRDRPRVVRVAVHGDVDAGTAPLLELALLQALDQGQDRLEVDLAGVTHFSCAGLVVLLQTAERCRGDFAVVRTAAAVRRLLRVLEPPLLLTPAGDADAAADLRI
jgi:anti-anti-sigma factor